MAHAQAGKFARGWVREDQFLASGWHHTVSARTVASKATEEAVCNVTVNDIPATAWMQHDPPSAASLRSARPARRNNFNRPIEVVRI